MSTEAIMRTLTIQTPTDSNWRGRSIPRIPAPLGRVIVVFIGLTLLAAAGLKSLEPSDRNFATRMGRTAIVAGEVLLGFWLLSGINPRLSRRIGAACFATFACFTAYKWWNGADSCGCWGAMKVPPLYTFGFDLLSASILSLIPLPKVARSGCANRTGHGYLTVRGYFWSVGAVAGAALLVGFAARPAPTLLVHPAIDSNLLPQAPAHAATTRAESQLVCDLGYVLPGSSHGVSFFVANSGQAPIKLLRAESQCHCFTVPKLPPEIPPGGMAIDATFDAPNITSVYGKHIMVYTTDPVHPSFALGLRCRIGLPLHLSPESVSSETGNPATVLLFNDGDDPVRLLYATCADAFIVLPIPRDPVPPKGSVTMSVTVTNPLHHSAVMRLHTTSDVQPVLDLPVAVPPK